MSNTVKGIRELTEQEEMTIRQLKSLRLSTMAEAYEQQIMDPNSSIGSFAARISSIVTAECDARRSKKINKIIAKANLKYSNAFIDDSIYDPDRHLNVELIQHLSRDMNQWLDSGTNLLLTGATGTGKTWLCNALMVQAAHKYKSIKSYKTQSLMLEMDRHYQDGTLLQFENEIASYDLLFIDDFGLADNSFVHSRYLFEILDARCPKKTTMIATQIPITNWYSIFKDDTYADACLDRVLNHAYRLPMEGASQRKKYNTL